jgi:hypothetical protein
MPTLTLARKATVDDYIPRSSGLYTITPEMALAWLERISNPRAIPIGVLDAYARDMKADNWSPNGETIKWDVEGHCFDGENRLRACVLAGVPFQSWVIVGLPVQARKTVDLGAKRLLAQVLRNGGERYGTQLSGVATLIWRWERGREAFMEKGLRPTFIELEHLINNNPGIKTSTELVHGSYGKAARMSHSSTVPAMIHYYAFKKHGDEATRFLEQVASGKNIEPGDPAYALRELLIKKGRTQNRFIQRETLSWWIPAWNAHAQVKPLRRIAPVDFSDEEQLVIL